MEKTLDIIHTDGWTKKEKYFEVKHDKSMFAMLDNGSHYAGDIFTQEEAEKLRDFLNYHYPKENK